MCVYMSTVITHCDLQSPLTGSIFNPSLQDNKPQATYLHIRCMCFGNYVLTSPPYLPFFPSVSHLLNLLEGSLLLFKRETFRFT